MLDTGICAKPPPPNLNQETPPRVSLGRFGEGAETQAGRPWHAPMALRGCNQIFVWRRIKATFTTSGQIVIEIAKSFSD
jgi:hypothetical protein